MLWRCHVAEGGPSSCKIAEYQAPRLHSAMVPLSLHAIIGGPQPAQPWLQQLRRCRRAAATAWPRRTLLRRVDAASKCAEPNPWGATPGAHLHGNRPAPPPSSPVSSACSCCCDCRHDKVAWAGARCWHACAHRRPLTRSSALPFRPSPAPSGCAAAEGAVLDPVGPLGPLTSRLRVRCFCCSLRCHSQVPLSRCEEEGSVNECYAAIEERLKVRRPGPCPCTRLR